MAAWVTKGARRRDSGRLRRSAHGANVPLARAVLPVEVSKALLTRAITATPTPAESAVPRVPRQPFPLAPGHTIRFGSVLTLLCEAEALWSAIQERAAS